MDTLVDTKVYYKVFDKSFKKSSHIYAIKNNESYEEITNNRKAIVEYYKNNSNLILLNQVHGAKVIDLDLNSQSDQEGDAMLTTKSNLILAIQTADCVPILLSTKDGKVIAAIHAGWKSTLLNIIENTIDKIHEKSNSSIKVFIGPCIMQDSYEVDLEFAEQFTESEQEGFFKPGLKKKLNFNLPGLIISRLHNLNITDISFLNHDTYKMEDLYPSRRRLFHQNALPLKEFILSTIVK